MGLWLWRAYAHLLPVSRQRFYRKWKHERPPVRLSGLQRVRSISHPGQEYSGVASVDFILVLFHVWIKI